MVIDSLDKKTQEAFYSNMLQLYKDVKDKEILNKTQEKYNKEIDSIQSDYFKKNHDIDINTEKTQASFAIAKEELPRIEQIFYNNFKKSDQNINAIINQSKIDLMSSMFEKIMDDKILQFYMFFDAFESNNYKITEEMFLKAKNSIQNLPSIPSYRKFDKCCKKLKSYYIKHLDILDEENEYVQNVIFKDNRHIFNKYRVKQNKILSLKKLETEKFTLNLQNVDFWHSRRIFYVKDEQKTYQNIFKLIKKYRKKYRTALLDTYGDFIDSHFASLKEKYDKTYAKFLKNIDYLQNLVKNYNYDDIKHIYDLYTTDKKGNNAYAKNGNQNTQEKTFFDFWNYDTFINNIFDTNHLKNSKFERNIENYFYQVFYKFKQENNKQKFYIKSDDGILLKFLLLAESSEKFFQYKIKSQFDYFNGFNKKICEDFLEKITEYFGQIRISFQDLHQKISNAIISFEKYCDKGQFLPEKKLLDDDKMLLKKLDRISCSLYFSSLFGFYLNESKQYDHIHVHDLSYSYDEAYRILDEKAWTFEKNEKEKFNKDHINAVKNFQNALKNELEDCFSKKKDELKIFDKYIEKNKINDEFITFVKKSVLLNVRLAFLLFETSNAALNITNIIEEHFLFNTKNEKGVLFKKYISNIDIQQCEIVNAIQLNYDVYNLSSFYFLFKCGFLYYDDKFEFLKIDQKNSKKSQKI